MNERVRDIIRYFSDFYEDFDEKRAYDMLGKLQIDASDRLKTMSKGTKEKVQLILVMSRHADLYILDEPIAGVDPAARDFILNIILSNYEPEASILISTHLIADIENILDEVIFIDHGQIRLTASVDDIRMNNGKSVDVTFQGGIQMLKKLFKYEFKSTAKIMLILYAILIVTTAVGSVVLYSLDLDQAGESKLASILSVSAIVLYILAIFAVLIVMYVYLCVHFYRTMYSAQGYLTHTLPVKALAPFHVKLITSFVWMFLSMALMTVSIVVLIASASHGPHGRILLPPGMRYSVRMYFPSVSSSRWY